MHSWDEAIRLAGAAQEKELVELFRQRRREAEWDYEAMAEPIQLTGTKGDDALDAFNRKIQSWADQIGVSLAVEKLSTSYPDPEAWALRLDEANARLALASD